jgi:hypothetical protein
MEDNMRRYDEINNMLIKFMDKHVLNNQNEIIKAVQYALAWVIDKDEPDELLTNYLN